MSSIPTKQIDGDVVVGRNANIGGGASVQGNVRIGHNLKVNGWLEARNIKAANKGLFKTEARLREVYPLPHDGWWALVGDTLPAAIYIADGGEWVNTGNTGGEPTIDSDHYDEVIEQVQNDVKALSSNDALIEEKNTQQDAWLSELQNSAESSSNRISELSSWVQSVEGVAGEALQTANSAKSNIATIAPQVEENNNGILTNAGDISSLNVRVSANEAEIADLSTEVDAINQSKGEADGIATLGSDGKVTASQLPDYKDVIEFAYVVSDIIVKTGTSVSKSSTDDGCCVVYNKTTERFVLAVGNLLLVEYYASWLDGAKFGTGKTDGREPVAGKLYLCTATGKVYRQSGTGLEVIGANVDLGESIGMAYPGDKGAQLAATIATHTEEISDLTAECRALDEAYHSADEGLQKSIDANKASIAANASTIATHTEEISNLTAECRALDEAYHSADEQLSARINTNAAGITDNAAKITENANSIAAVRLTAAVNKLDITKINIVNFHGFETMANLQDQQSAQDRQDASGKILYLQDVGYFACLEDPTLPIGWHDDADWDGERYNTTTDGIKHPRPDTIFRLNSNLYHGGIDAGVSYLTKFADNDELRGVEKRLDATISELETLGDTVEQNFEHCDAALRKTMASLVPTGLTVGELPRLTLGNLEPVFLTAKLEPDTVAQNIIYITDNQVVSVAPNGKITMIAPGHAEIHVIPTLNTALAKSVAVEVVEPTVMGVSIAATSGDEGDEEGATSEMRLLSDDTIRFN